MFLKCLPLYSGRIKSIQWLLILLLLATPTHQQLQYSLCILNMSLSSVKKDFYIVSSLGNDGKCQHIFIFWKQFSIEGVDILVIFLQYRCCHSVNTLHSLRQHDTYMCQWTRAPLVQIMAHHLLGCQAIIWTNDDLLSIGTNFNEILFTILTFSFKKILLRVSSSKWQPFCLGLNVFMYSKSCSRCLHGTTIM